MRRMPLWSALPSCLFFLGIAVAVGAQEDIRGDSRGTDLGGSQGQPLIRSPSETGAFESKPDDAAMIAMGLRPFDDSDVEMKSLMTSIQLGGGCPTGPHEGCPGVRERFIEGGDRLARYLIRQFEESEREDVPGAGLYLQYVAYTGSGVGFDYLTSRLKNRAALTDLQMSQTIMALGRMGDERAIDAVLPLFDETESSSVRADVVRAVVRTMEASGERPPHAVAWLQSLAKQPHYEHYVSKKLKSLGVEG